MTIEEEAAKDTELTTKNIAEVLMNNAKNYSKWAGRHARLLRSAKELEVKLDRLWMSRYLYYKKDDPESLSLRSELQECVSGDTEYSELKLEREKIMVKIDFVENVMKAINSLGYNARTLVDYERFKNGTS